MREKLVVEQLPPKDNPAEKKIVESSPENK